VQDATDGGIVIFGAPGSSVKNNTIVAKTRTLLGGINLVDYAPMNGNYTGTTVTGNTFALVHNGDGSVSLRANANNNYVTAENAGAAPLIANRTAIGPWEEFDLIQD
jgi:hypothetical protein